MEFFRNKRKVCLLLAFVLALLAAAGIAAGIVYLVMKGKGAVFYAEYEGTRFYSGQEEEVVLYGSQNPHVFSVYAADGDTADFTVEITAREENNFYFILDGKELRYLYEDGQEENDYSEIFSLSSGTDWFMLTVPQGNTVEDLLALRFGGEIETVREIEENLAYFAIRVTCGGYELELPFLFPVEAESVSLDPSEICF